MLNEENLGLRYLELYGDFGNYLVITERKKIDCLGLVMCVKFCNLATDLC